MMKQGALGNSIQKLLKLGELEHFPLFFKTIFFKRSQTCLLTETSEFQHRRRIKTEEKAKVVASVWKEEFIKFLAAIFCLGRF